MAPKEQNSSLALSQPELPHREEFKGGRTDTGKESSIRRIAEDPACGLQSDSEMRGRQPRGDTLFNCWHLSFYRSLSGVARIFKLWSCDESSSRRVLSRNGLHWKRFMLYASEYVRYDVLMRIYVMCNSKSGIATLPTFFHACTIKISSDKNYQKLIRV